MKTGKTLGTLAGSETGDEKMSHLNDVMTKKADQLFQTTRHRQDLFAPGIA